MSFQQKQEYSVTESGDDLVKSPATAAMKPLKKTRRKKTLMEHYKIIESPSDSNNLSNSTSTFSSSSLVNSNAIINASAASGHTPPSIHAANIGNSPPRTILPSLSSVILSKDLDELKHVNPQLPPILLNHYNQQQQHVESNNSNEKSPSSLSNSSKSIKKRKSRNEPNSPSLIINTNNNITRDFQVEYTGNNSIFGVLKKPKHANIASYETILNLSDTNSNQHVKTPPTTTTWSQEPQIQSTNKRKRKQKKP